MWIAVRWKHTNKKALSIIVQTHTHTYYFVMEAARKQWAGRQAEMIDRTLGYFCTFLTVPDSSHIVQVCKLRTRMTLTMVCRCKLLSSSTTPKGHLNISTVRTLSIRNLYIRFNTGHYSAIGIAKKNSSHLYILYIYIYSIHMSF
jgi:hypothetical protein